MTDDPRDILRAAGVECAEVEAWWALEWWCGECNDLHEHTVGRDTGGRPREFDVGDAAALALARLVAKYKAEAEGARKLGHDWQLVADDQQQLVAKYKWQRDEAARAMWRIECVYDGIFDEDEAAAHIIADLDRRWEELHP